MSGQLERLAQADQILAEARSDIEARRTLQAAMKAMRLRSYAETARRLAREARLGTSSVNHATVVKSLAERCAADAVDEGQRVGQIARKGQHSSAPGADEGPVSLEDLGIKDASRLSEWRKLRDNYTDEALIELERQANDADETLSHKELVRGRSNAQRMQSSETNEWYTPWECIEAARRVLGGIDLDPASSEQANRTVQAARYYTKDDDGLRQPWKGRVWLNPPYGGNAGAFVKRLAEHAANGEVPAAITLVSSHSTDTAWFRPLWDCVLCFTYGRIQFISSDGRGDAATHGSVFAYFGPDRQAFAEAFSQFGAVMSRWT